MQYKIIYQEDQKIKSKIVDTLDTNNLNIIKIEEINSNKLNLRLYSSHDDEIVLLFYEISILLSSKLPLKDIIELLLKSYQKGFQRDILKTINKALEDGQPIYQSLQKWQNELGYLPLLFFKLGEENGNLSVALNSLYEILDENQKIKRKIKTVFQYPLILLISFFISLGIIFSFVIPKFEYLFIQFGDNLPLSTAILLWIKNILYQNYSIIFILLFILLFFLHFTITTHRYYFDKILFCSIPYLSKMKRYLIFYKFFLSASLIVKSKHNFQDALIYSKHTANNQYFLDKVSHIIQEINNGTSLNQAFKNSNLFEEINIRMISVGENINNFELILENLTYLNKQQLTKSLDEFIAILNPFLIFIISSFILWLVLAIMTPVWEMSNFIK